jgi:lysozyme
VASKEAALKILAAFTPSFEGFRTHPYFCPAGIATIGCGSTRYENGVQVQITDAPITRERAIQLMMHELEFVYLPAVLALCPIKMTDEQLAAIVDFTYNCGISALRSSTLRKKINAGQWDEVPAQLMRWIYGGSKVLEGLKRRRAAESNLIRPA